ncbi:hypothetical protein E2562_038336 [Oryza meyeriana var. granulata]|uniref:Uncharacterized protein n=1 Tax=Oryza meyeriana var. granulata TaxID=110450 RepID=A0A6G1FGL5_9ORYZ|nr:hypothetical protein E2562_038336 [Oryza meyeriana var. granulata]
MAALTMYVPPHRQSRRRRHELGKRPAHGCSPSSACRGKPKREGGAEAIFPARSVGLELFGADRIN